MQLAQILPADAVIPHLQVRDKKQAFKQCAVIASQVTSIPEREIYVVLMERENAGCTGMGSGVCIPHGRLEELKEPLAIFARLDKPIDFGAPDGKKVDLIFLLLTPASANTEHLKSLSLISKILRDKKLCEQLRNAQGSELYSLLIKNNVEE